MGNDTEISSTPQDADVEHHEVLMSSTPVMWESWRELEQLSVILELREVMKVMMVGG